MQRYQVFIDDHSIFIGDQRKSIQQYNCVFELFEPIESDILYLVDWLSKEREATQQIFLNSSDHEALWELFQAQFKVIEAAGGVVKNGNNEALFIYRLGKWDLPKGKLESGEYPKDAAVREVEEECGISDLQLEKELPSTYHMYFHKEKWVLKRTYWFNMKYLGDEELVPQTEESIEKVVWVDSSNLSKQTSNTYSSLMQLLQSV